MKAHAASIMLLLTACSGPQPGAPAEPSSDQIATAPKDAPEEVAEPALAPVATLAGEWRVAGIDGAEFDEPYGLALSGSDSEIWWEPRCAGAARRYSIDGVRLTMGEAEPAAPIEPGAHPPPVCAIGLPPRLADVIRALDAAKTIGRTASNGVQISGGEHSLLLFSQ